MAGYLEVISTVLALGQAVGNLSESAPDPTQTAIFETYTAVRVLNERLGGIENAILTVHEQLSELPFTIDDRNEAQTAREAEGNLNSSLIGIQFAYGQMLDDIASGRVNRAAAEARFRAYLREVRIDFSHNLSNIIQFSKLGLQTAIVGVTFERYMNLELGMSELAANNTARERLYMIRLRISEVIIPMITEFEASVENARAAVSALAGGEWWTEGGQAINREISFVATHPVTSHIFCVSLETTDGSSGARYRYYSLPSTHPIFVQLLPPDANGSPVRICNADFIPFDNYGYRIYVFAQADLNIVGKQVNRGPRGAGSSSWSGTFPFRIASPYWIDAQAPYIKARDWHNSFSAEIRALNLATSKLEIASLYRDGAIKSLDDFERALNKNSQVSERYLTAEAFFIEIKKLDLTVAGSLDSQMLNADRQIAAILTQELRRSITEAAIAADDEIEAGMRRFMRAIRAYEESDGQALKDVAVVLEVAVRAMAVYSALDSLSSAAELEKMTSPPEQSQPEEFPATQSEPAASDQVATTDAGDRNPANATTNELELRTGVPPHDVDRIIRHLDQLGVPTGDPMENGVTPQEALIAEGWELLADWGISGADLSRATTWQEIRNGGLRQAARAALTGKVRGTPLGVVSIVFSPSRQLGDDSVMSQSYRRQLAEQLMARQAAIMEWRLPNFGREHLPMYPVMAPPSPAMRAPP